MSLKKYKKISRDCKVFFKLKSSKKRFLTILKDGEKVCNVLRIFKTKILIKLSK